MAAGHIAAPGGARYHSAIPSFARIALHPSGVSLAQLP